MTRVLVSCALLALSLTSCASFASREPDAAVTLRYGAVNFTRDQDWNRIDDPVVGGVALDWPIAAGPWHYEVGLSYFEASTDLGPGGSFDTNTTELSAGVRRPFTPLWRVLNTYLGVGLAALYSEQRFRPSVGLSTDTEEWNSALYLSGGAWGLWGDQARIGFEVRYLAEELFDSGDLNLDNVQVAVTLGYGF